MGFDWKQWAGPGPLAGLLVAGMTATVYAIFAAGWLLWLTPFLLAKRNSTSPEKLDRRARWGIVLVVIAFSMLWQNRFWERPLSAWRAVFSIVCLLLAALLSWTGARALGRQWRLDAGLSPDHQLITSGPYRVVRHPIYTSMLCLFTATGCLFTPIPVLLLSLVVFISGTEIRVRIEDKLLASRFGERFQEYQRRVPAYIPFVR
jgi:protein-S-isoprenylcysteine O-methyltransferase Ste14